MLKTLLFFCALPILLGANADRYAILKSIEWGFLEFLRDGVKPGYLKEAIQHFQLPHFFRDEEFDRPDYGLMSLITDEETCTLCGILVNVIIEERKLGLGREQLAGEVAAICIDFGIENERVCKGAIDLNVDIIIHIADKHKDLDGKRICAILLQSNGCSANSTDLEWSVDLPSGYTSKKNRSKSEESLKILQLSDLHYDPLYTPGKSNECGEPLCCQNDQETGDVEAGTACGYWSDYKAADVPEYLFDEVLRQAQTSNPDYVYFTGDIVSHRVWSTTQIDNTRDIKLVYQKLKDAFDVPIYPVVGNHEPHPINQYCFTEDESSYSTSWVYELVIEEFPNLPPEAKETILLGGFYTVSPREGFRVIVLNNNIAYTANWWLIDSSYDPYEQLAWLVKTLKEAEDNNESVHILSHIPSGNGAVLKVWSREYNRIVERFANTITGQFNGHTHRDQFMVHYNTSQPEQVINVAWNGASITTFDNANPSFKVYSTDSSTLELLDAEEWTFNLTKANLNPEASPEWYKLYSFKDAFGVDNLGPDEIGNLLVRMTKDHSLINNYHVFRSRNADPSVAVECDSKCQKKYLCEISVSEVGDRSHCERLEELYDQNN
ncbi:sphingomyelin phosphodiesterase-like [Cylas formicarius]|uniref:sphingomyelin phosphodiesterase-like n=1 Tax=Cylas formicarius TaxID=197179 RepID=UPI00295885B6|nr:sphingomyelin phosphodiesterase-like [Cylas formicarius]